MQTKILFSVLVASLAVLAACSSPTLPLEVDPDLFTTSATDEYEMTSVDLTSRLIVDEFHYPPNLNEDCFGGDYEWIARVDGSYELAAVADQYREMFLAYNGQRLLESGGDGFFALLVRENEEDEQSWFCKRINEMVVNMRRGQDGAWIKFTLNENGFPVRMQIIPSGTVTGFTFHRMKIMPYPERSS